MLSRRSSFRTCFLLSTVLLPGFPTLGITAEETANEAEQSSAPREPVVAPREPVYILRYRFQPNESRYYEIDYEATITVRKGDAMLKTIQKTETRKHYNVVSVDEQGRTTLEPVIDHIHMSASQDDDPPITFDSRDDKQPPEIFSSVERSIGRPLSRIRVNPNGELLTATALAASKQQNTSHRREKEPGSNSSQNFLVVFPVAPIPLGGVWKDQLTVRVSVDKTLSQPITLQRFYMLESVEGDLATISLKTTILTPIRNKEFKAQLIQRSPSGTIVFDLQRGLIVSRELKVDERVIGYAGGGSMMHAVSRLYERLVTKADVARKPVIVPGPPTIR